MPCKLRVVSGFGLISQGVFRAQQSILTSLRVLFLRNAKRCKSYEIL
ncbi:hypothetical protein MTBPR1_50080 [Candidatus Terasakiella magnetica]|uniref:Uncharacterized protein n=1 Tax=Candidatus Terasakiella magnetica TaxID=1867952 RepID=A0A1C3RJ84_9PROT|nr:hypothetical protein MTBPR1_50080 [Candidatus Terasakiella magnetica]